MDWMLAALAKPGPLIAQPLYWRGRASTVSKYDLAQFHAQSKSGNALEALEKLEKPTGRHHTVGLIV
jgi:hypothetical protein